MTMEVHDRAGCDRVAGAENADPTFSDVERITVDGEAIQRVQKMLSSSADAAHVPKKQAQGVDSTATASQVQRSATAPAVRCFVPCVIEFSLLGICLRSLRIAKAKKRSKSTKASSSSSLKSSVGMLSIGTRAMLSRLVASTVWSSFDAAIGVWDCLRNPSGVAADERAATERETADCIRFEALRHLEVCAVHSALYVCRERTDQLSTNMIMIMSVSVSVSMSMSMVIEMITSCDYDLTMMAMTKIMRMLMELMTAISLISFSTRAWRLRT